MLEVDWIAFTYAHDQSGLPDTSLDASSLYSVESNYRQAGGYVYRESRSDRLWVFHWPHHGKDTLVHGSYYPAKAPGISGE